MKVTLFLPRKNYLSSTSLPNYKSILITQNRTLSSIPSPPKQNKKQNNKKTHNQIILLSSLPTTVLLVPLGCGNREDPGDTVPGELDFLSAGGLY